MTGKFSPAEMITPQEALRIFEHSTTEEIARAKDLYDTYRESIKPQSNDVFWNFMSLLSFIYVAGRIQGIREERAKKSA